jgi:two-component system response regulator YesN
LIISVAGHARHLIAYVQTGDTGNAKRLLNDMLGEIVTHTSGNLESFKAKLYELTAILMRAAVDVGAPLEQMSEYIAYYTKILAENTTLEELCHMTSEIMDSFIRVVYEHRSFNKENKHLADAINYIKNHYMDEIALVTVADKIYVNRYYLSHLFRRELNTTFKDYLGKIRMEESLGCSDLVK